MLNIRIKELRKQKKLNQTELAKLIGVGRTTITEYEAGRITPPYEKIQALANVFGVTVKYLTGESNIRDDEDVDPGILDIGTDIQRMISDLKSHKVVRFNGSNINQDIRSTIAKQLESAYEMINVLNKMNSM